MRKPISQREARRLRKRVNELEQIFEQQKDRWAADWPSSTIIHRLIPAEKTRAIVETARALRHPVVVTMKDDELRFWGVHS